MDVAKLQEILIRHKKWLNGEEGGIKADLQSANLRYADLRYADLRSADLRYANLQSANLRSAKNAELVWSQTVIAPEGALLVWKKCRDGILVKLRIPEESKRSNATGRKCRAEFADVIEVIGGEIGISLHDGETQYKAGERVTCDSWCDNRWEECAGGIHFWLTREEAEAHN